MPMGNPKDLVFVSTKTQRLVCFALEDLLFSHSFSAALSAIRNLNGSELNGRLLRVDFAENEKKGDVPSERPADGRVTDPRLSDRGHVNPQPLPYQPHPSSSGLASQSTFRGPVSSTPYISPMESKPPVDVVKGVVESLSQPQIHSILTLMKEMVEKNPEQAQQILKNNPQLAYALLHAQSIYGLVSQDKMKEVLVQRPPPSFSKFQSQQQQQQPNFPMRAPLPPAPTTRFPSNLPNDPRGDQFRPPMHDPRAAPPPLSNVDPRLTDPRLTDPRVAGRMGGDFGSFPPNFGPPPGVPLGPGGPMRDRGFPPPPLPSGPPLPRSAPLPIDPEHQELIQRVLRLTPEQIQQLPPQQRQQILELQKMYG